MAKEKLLCWIDGIKCYAMKGTTTTEGCKICRDVRLQEKTFKQAFARPELFKALIEGLRTPQKEG